MKNSKKQKSITRRLIPGLIFGFAVILGLGLIGDINKTSQVLREFNWKFYPLVILFTLLNYILRFFKWHFYLGQIGIKNLAIPESMRIFVAGFPLAVTPGKVGEALKGVWLKMKTDVPVGKGVSVVLAERISDGLAVLALSTLGVIAYPQYWPAFVIVLAGLLTIVILSQIKPIAYRLLDLGDKLPVISRFSASLRDFYEGSFAVFRPWATLFAVALGTISWLGEGIGLYFVLRGLGLPPSLETLAIAVFVLSFSTVIGAVSALPGGLGAAEISIAGMLSLTLGLDAALATSATLLIRLATLWFGVALGLIVWLFSFDLLGVNVES